ncbi:MAG: flavin-containing monooxygenase [Sinimarinibacterium flocculans]|uniref:flavin-containing monooxygenase n=1 Tax=Sinimarinibacterium flocculans TaxID=985250 RepID=UPI003C3E7595
MDDTLMPWAAAGRMPKIAIIGSGLSGLAAVVHLRKAGYDDVTVYEKAAAVGGTWRDNRYPGLSCDIASYWYSFTFAPNPRWSHRYPLGEEIRAYLEKVTDDFDIRRCIRFETPVERLVSTGQRWRLVTRHGEDTYDIVISATGILHHPKQPEIPGLRDFRGRVFHSSRWEDDAPVDGARVGVIGTGSTAAQIVGALGARCARLSCFQRTPQWMFPLLQKRYSGWWKWLMARVPGLPRLMYHAHRLALERTLGPATMGNTLMQRLFEWTCRWNLQRTVKDPDLRRKLTPDYRAGCKRLVICSTFYEAIVRDNVELVTDAIERLEPEGVRTRDGRLHALDTLVLCTGFHSNRFILPVDVIGSEGQRLADVWGEAPRAHRAMSVPGFPNLWFLEGPGGPVGNISLVSVSEIQIRYIVQVLDAMRRRGLAAVSPRRLSFERYNADLAQAVRRTIWATGGCRSWYIDASGDPNLYAHPPARFYRDMRRPDLAEYELTPAQASAERSHFRDQALERVE